MRRFSNLLFASICALSLLASCAGKDGDPGPAGPAGPAGPSLTGSIVGFVNPLDQFGDEQAKSGVTVTVENTSPLLTTTTDANGRYEFPNVKSGTYNIAFSKAGFGMVKIQGYPHVGGDQPSYLYSREIVGIATTTVTSIAVGAVQPPNSSNGFNDYVLPLTIRLANSSLPNANNGLYAQVFVGKTAAVTSATGIQMTSVSYYSGSTYPTYLSRGMMNRAGFATGTTAYAIVYGAPNYYDYGYVDLATGLPVYTSLSTTPSQVVSFIVP
jgi:hypothetical protein